MEHNEKKAKISLLACFLCSISGSVLALQAAKQATGIYKNMMYIWAIVLIILFIILLVISIKKFKLK